MPSSKSPRLRSLSSANPLRTFRSRFSMRTPVWTLSTLTLCSAEITLSTYHGTMVDAKNNQKDQGMTRTNLRFYEELAAHYHLIFDDWNAAIERQAQVLGPLIHSHANGNCLRVLDCSCGIGTQSLGFA